MTLMEDDWNDRTGEKMKQSGEEKMIASQDQR